MGAPQGLWNIDWLNANSVRKYPLREDAELWDDSRTFRIPNDLIVDLVWPVHAYASTDPSKFHIAAISIFTTGVVITLGYDGTPIGSATISVSSFTRNSMHVVQGTGNFFDSVGKLVIGSLDTVLSSAGAYSFGVTDAPIEITAIRPMLRNLSALYVQNGTELSAPIQDDVILQAGRNMELRVVRAIGDLPDTIIFDAIDGAGFNKDCICGENPDLPAIKTINGIGPDEQGNLELFPDDCLTFQTDSGSHKITMKDDCCKPCCGCEELGVLRATLELMAAQVNALENLGSRVESGMNSVTTNLTFAGKIISS